MVYIYKQMPHNGTGKIFLCDHVNSQHFVILISVNLQRNILFNVLLEFYKDQNCNCLVLIRNFIACIIDCKLSYEN